MSQMPGLQVCRPTAGVTALTLAALLTAGSAAARVGPITKIPAYAAVPTFTGNGWRFDYCTGGAPLVWEVSIANDTPSATTVTYTDDVRDGLNGEALSLLCPPVTLPPGVDPLTDVDCDPVDHTLEIRNILIPPCTRAVLRFETAFAPAGFEIVCSGGDVLEGADRFRTRNPFDDPDPRGDDTCILGNPMCGPGPSGNVHLNTSATDENGPPLLPGDRLVWRTWLDLRFAGGPPPLEYLWPNALGVGDPEPIADYLTFLDWVDRPLEPGAVYSFDPGTRELLVADPDLASPPSADMTPGTESEIVSWLAEVDCAIPQGTSLCHFGIARFPPALTFGDDPSTPTDEGDATCVTPVGPDFSTSTKTVTDGDRSGDAQPGEILTYLVSVNNSAVCDDRLLNCECDANDVLVIDSFDSTQLEIVDVRNDGTQTAPDEVQWVVPSVGAFGRTGSIRWLFFDARVRSDVRDGERICNSVSILSPEQVNVADGGLSMCPTRPMTDVSDACITVRIPAVPLVAVDKSVAPPLVPPETGYAIGSTVTYTVDVINVGGAPAANVQVWDCLDPAIDPLLVNPLLGTVDGAPAPVPACTSGHWIRWPAIPSLAGGGGTASFDFEVTIPLDTTDGTIIGNQASSSAAGLPTAASNPVDIPVCAPFIELQKSLPSSAYGEGQPIDWTLTVSNPSGCRATSIDVSDVVDRSLVEDVPTLVWTDPPGASSSYDAGTGTISWNLPTLAAGASADITITSQIRTGVAPAEICNEAEGAWAESLTPVMSSPPGGACADILDGCVPIPEARPVLGHRSGTDDVRFEWTMLAEALDGYRVCAIDGVKTEIPAACAGGAPAVVGPVPGCDPTIVSECVHFGALPEAAGAMLFYQVKGMCMGIEGQ